MEKTCPDGQMLVNGQCVSCNNVHNGMQYCTRCTYDTANAQIQCKECESGYRFLNTIHSSICVRASIFNLSGTEFTFIALFAVALAFALIILSIWLASWVKQRRAVRAAKERTSALTNKTLYMT